MSNIDEKNKDLQEEKDYNIEEHNESQKDEDSSNDNLNEQDNLSEQNLKKETNKNDNIANKSDFEDDSLKNIMSDFMIIVQFLLSENTKSLSHLFSKGIKIENLEVVYRNRKEISDMVGDSHLQLFTYFDTLDIVGQISYFLDSKSASQLLNLYLKEENVNQIVEWNYSTLDFIKELFIYFVSLFNNVLSEKLNQIVLTDPLNVMLLKGTSINLDQLENNWICVKYHISELELDKPILIYHVLSFTVIKKLMMLIKSSEDDISSLPFKDNQEEDENLSVFGKSITTVSPIRYKSLPIIPPKKRNEVNEDNSISLLLDLKMKLTVELGRAKMNMDKILSLGEGSIIELNKLAGEPVDLFVNSNLIAKGEVVVIDQNFGVRITEIIGTSKRLESIF